MLPRLLNRLAQWGVKDMDLQSLDEKLSTQIAVLDTFEKGSLKGKLGDYLSEFPQFLNLRSQIIPEYISPQLQQIKAIYSINGKIHKSTRPFKGNELQSVQIVYDNCGQDESGLCFRGRIIQKDLELVLGDESLMHHTFPVPQENQLLVSRQFKKEKWQITTQGQTVAYRGQEPLFPGGGYYKPGCALEAINPRVFTLSSVDGLETQVIFEDTPDTLKNEQLSLGSALRLGYSQIKLKDSAGTEQIYQSIGYKQENLAVNQVDIIYAQKIF